MKLNYVQSMVRYCFDLTDPNSANAPIATLLIAESEGANYAAAVALSPSLLRELDKITADMLSDVPHLLKQTTQEVMSSKEFDGDPEHVLLALQHSLRNTLNVSEILPKQEVEIAEPADVGTTLLKIATRKLFEVAAEEGLITLPPGKRRSLIESIGRRLGLGASEEHDQTAEIEGIPAQEFWPMERAQAAPRQAMAAG